MATVTLDGFMPHINPKVPGCPDPTVRNAIIQVATDLCSRSGCWNELLASASVTSGSFPYTVPVSAHGRLVRLLSAKVDGANLTETTYGKLDGVDEWDTKTGTPSHYLFNAAGKLIVYPLPAATASLRLRVAYTPARNATVLEDFMYTRWMNEIASGAIALLAGEPNRSWSNPEQYITHSKLYEQGVAKATIETNRNFTTGEMAVSMRPLA
jgi:hypothetical protein